MPREYFQAYHSYRKSIDPLNFEERGRLFTALLLYSETGTPPELEGNERFIFPTIQAQIDRDNEKYEEKCKKNRQNGSIGGGERGQSGANGGERPPNAPQGKGKGKGKGEGEGEGKGDNNNPAEPGGTLREIISYLNSKAGTNYKPNTASTMRHINARLNESYAPDDFKKVIDFKCAEWLDTDFKKFLRPETLFGTKFESYLNQAHLVSPKPPTPPKDLSGYKWEGEDAF